MTLSPARFRALVLALTPVFTALLFLQSGCATQRPVAAAPAAAGLQLRLIGEQRIAPRLSVDGTNVGGLSGVDYSPARDEWIAESDDKAEYGPGRAYTFRLPYDERAVGPVQITGVVVLRQPDGSAYPDEHNAALHGGEIPDLESIRYDPSDGTLWYTSEGDRRRGMNSFVRHAAPDGSYLGGLPLPEAFRFHADAEIGPRHNTTFEGLTFAPDARSLWVGMEGPLYQDGPLPTTTHGALNRFTQFDRDGRVLAQYAYPLDPIPVAPVAGGFADNGVSEILAASPTRLLVLERSGRQATSGRNGRFEFQVRLFEADIAGATDVRNVAALAGANVTPMRKRLVLDLNRARLGRVDNLEGITWGRTLANGHRTLVLISDDNFNATQVTQVLVFEVLAGAP